MAYCINETEAGITRYPLHSHEHWEIMYYAFGTGTLVTPDHEFPFSPGTILLVPPNLPHGSQAPGGFRNISVGGNFGHLFAFTRVVSLCDNPAHEGELLTRMILNNQYGNPEYLAHLCQAYGHFLLQNIRADRNSANAVHRAVAQITENFTDPELNVTEILCESGYSEDYIRAQFREMMDTTPTDFLTRMRIDHARTLLDIYRNTRSVAQIAEQCGFTDPVYFSKRFKAQIGISPRKYVQRLLGNDR